MIYRISIVILCLIALYAGYQIYDIASLKSHAYEVNEGQYIGNADGDVIVVEFLDYTCPHCRAIAPIIDEAIAKDENAVLLPRPILSTNEKGTVAAFTAYAAAKSDGFLTAHDYLLNNPFPDPDIYVQDMALVLGIDEETLEANLQDKAIFNMVSNNFRALTNLGANAIPAFLIKSTKTGKEILFVPDGQTRSVDQFLALFNDVRSE